jgi:hypothetical protein
MIKQKKSTIFKFHNTSKRKQENIDFSMGGGASLLNVDSGDYSTPNVKQARKISKVPFKILDAPAL